MIVKFFFYKLKQLNCHYTIMTYMIKTLNDIFIKVNNNVKIE